MGLKIQASKQVFKQNNLLAKASNDRSLELYFVFQLGENVNLVTLLKVATKKLTKPVNFLSLPRMKECHRLEKSFFFIPLPLIPYVGTIALLVT